MQPDAAADLLGELPEEHTEKILEEMSRRSAKKFPSLLEFKENSAAGRMTTEYIALPVTADAHDAIEALRHFEAGVETVSTILPGRFASDPGRHAVPLAKLVLAAPRATPLLSLTQEPLISSHVGADRKRSSGALRQIQSADTARR